MPSAFCHSMFFKTFHPEGLETFILLFKMHPEPHYCSQLHFMSQPPHLCPRVCNSFCSGLPSPSTSATGPSLPFRSYHRSTPSVAAPRFLCPPPPPGLRGPPSPLSTWPTSSLLLCGAHAAPGRRAFAPFIEGPSEDSGGHIEGPQEYL